MRKLHKQNGVVNLEKILKIIFALIGNYFMALTREKF